MPEAEVYDVNCGTRWSPTASTTSWRGPTENSERRPVRTLDRPDG